MPWTDLELEGTGHKRVSDFVAAFFDNEYERVSVIRFEMIPLTAPDGWEMVAPGRCLRKVKDDEAE